MSLRLFPCKPWHSSFCILDFFFLYCREGQRVGTVLWQLYWSVKFNIIPALTVWSLRGWRASETYLKRNIFRFYFLPCYFSESLFSSKPGINLLLCIPSKTVMHFWPGFPSLPLIWSNIRKRLTQSGPVLNPFTISSVNCLAVSRSMQFCVYWEYHSLFFISDISGTLIAEVPDCLLVSNASHSHSAPVHPHVCGEQQHKAVNWHASKVWAGNWSRKMTAWVSNLC